MPLYVIKRRGEEGNRHHSRVPIYRVPTYRVHKNESVFERRHLGRRWHKPGRESKKSVRDEKEWIFSGKISDRGIDCPKWKVTAAIGARLGHAAESAQRAAE